MTSKSEALRELAAVMEKHDIYILTGCEPKADVFHKPTGSRLTIRGGFNGQKLKEELADQLEKGDGDE